MHLLEIARGEDTKLQVFRLPCDLPCPPPGPQRLVELSEVRVDVRHERADPRVPAVVVQPLGETLGLAQALQRLPDLTELVQDRPQLDANLEGLLHHGWGLGKRVDELQRLLEPDASVLERGE